MQTIMMDVDGVLVRGRPQDGAHLFTDLEKDLGIQLDLLQREFFVPRWPAIVTGKKPLLPELSEALGVIAPDVSAETLVDYWFRNDSRIDADVLAAMDTVRASGGRVYLATNQEHRRADYLMVDMGLSHHVDGIYYSAAIGHRKPSSEFYGHISRVGGFRSSEVTLIDDTEENVVAAQAFGWNAVHWTPGMNVLTALAGAHA